MEFEEFFNGPVFFIFIAGFAFLLVFMGIPSIIHVANERLLFDNNNLKRKNHSYGISRLGGVAVFCSLILTTLFFSNSLNSQTSNYLIASFILLFAVGLKDDLWGVNASTKFFIQLFTALSVVLLADIRITDFHGIFGVHSLPYWASILFSTVLIIFLTNSFNLIDGIDGLVGMTGLVVSISFGVLLVAMGAYGYAGLAFTLSGACMGFLMFNISPARIFMGDAGSMLIGLVAAILAIQFIETNISKILAPSRFFSAPAMAIAILIGPIFDVFRVFIIRIIRGNSPFTADVNHTHHRLLRMGLSHVQATFLLISFNNFLIAFVIHMQSLGNLTLIAILFFCCILFNITLSYLLRARERRAFKPVPKEVADSILIGQA